MEIRRYFILITERHQYTSYLKFKHTKVNLFFWQICLSDKMVIWRSDCSDSLSIKLPVKGPSRVYMSQFWENWVRIEKYKLTVARKARIVRYKLTILTKKKKSLNCKFISHKSMKKKFELQVCITQFWENWVRIVR